jgi:hypothetical protein
MTTTLEPTHRTVNRGTVEMAATSERIERSADADRAAREARTSSRSAIESILDVLGYAGELADELEDEAWARGHVWRVAAA